MIKIERFYYGTQMNCDRRNISYQTYIPVHYISHSLSEIDKEIENNNFGGLKYEVSKFDFWKAPIINIDFEIAAGKGWKEKDGVFSYSSVSQIETVAVAILGYIDHSAHAKYYNDIAKCITYFAVPLTDDTVEGRLTKLSIDSFEEYPVYYEVKKKTSKSFVFRYREILNEVPYPTHDRPMLAPLEYLQQEFAQNLYVGEMVEKTIDEETVTFDCRLPVVRFWEEVDGEKIPQYYTYEYRRIGKQGGYRDSLNEFCEVTLKKVNPEKVKQDEEWFFIDKKFYFA